MKKKSKKSKSFFKLPSKKLVVKLAVDITALVSLVGIYAIGFWSPIKEDTFYRLNSGASVSGVASQMKAQGLINSENLFKVSVVLLGGRVQTGEYELDKNRGIWRIAKMMTRGDVASTVIVIPEGLTLKQIKNQLLAEETLSGDVVCASKENTNESDSVCNLKEGDLFPDTYRVARGTARLDVLRLSHSKMLSIRKDIEKLGKKAPSPLKSWDDVITLASIVQKETPMVSEMPIVASVYLNRLKKKMRLQADPTVVYAITDGLGDMQGAGLFTGHLKRENPYNTYMNHGLPPGPIANVGRAAIIAVLNPADTNYLFFVADGQGGHVFARSYEEHQKNHVNWREIKKARKAANSK